MSTPTCNYTWPSLISPRLIITSIEMPYGRFFTPMVSLLASSTSWRTCIRGHRSLCNLVVIWGATFLSPMVCSRAMWLPLCFLMCSWTSLLRKPLGHCQTVGWRLSSSLEGSWCTPLVRGPCLVPPLLCYYMQMTWFCSTWMLGSWWRCWRWLIFGRLRWWCTSMLPKPRSCQWVGCPLATCWHPHA